MDQQLRKYLLGELSSEEECPLEEQLLFDDELSEQLRVVEEELLDDYVSQQLSARERTRMETHFLTPPERQRKLRTARALRKHLTQTQAANAPGFRELLGQWLRQPGWSVAAPALLVIFLGVFTWQIFFSQSELDKGLVALNAAYREQRPLDAREPARVAPR